MERPDIRGIAVSAARGAISFFFNWFVLAANVNAWRQLGAIDSPSLSGLPGDGLFFKSSDPAGP